MVVELILSVLAVVGKPALRGSVEAVEGESRGVVGFEGLRRGGVR